MPSYNQDIFSVQAATSKGFIVSFEMKNAQNMLFVKTALLTKNVSSERIDQFVKKNVIVAHFFFEVLPARSLDMAYRALKQRRARQYRISREE